LLTRIKESIIGCFTDREKEFKMQIMVIHSDRETGNQEVVAAVVFDGNNPINAMDYAFRWTNNIDGSWSQGEDIAVDGHLYENPDFNPNVKVLAPLPTYLGRTYGHRSTSVGDVMIVDGEAYRVASFGFEKVEG
jgi:hypothetical protein